MVNYIEIGRRIATIRKATGLTQSEVCELCGISDKYLSNIERAKSIPSIEILMRICEVLKTTPDKILLGTSRIDNSDILQESISLLKLLDLKQLSLLNDIIEIISKHKIQT